jgi:hypothetical protein
MNKIISDECLYNILGHIKNCWTYGYPSGTTLENAIFEGLKPFYPSAKNLGSPSTIVDTAKEDDAFDVKGRKVLGHLKRITGGSNYEDNQFVEQTIPNFGKIKVRIPKSVITQVRRPKVDLKGYKGDAEKILNEQIEDYLKFAFETTNKDGYKNLYSVVVLYGIDKGYKSIFLTIEKFSLPKSSKFSIGQKENSEPCSYDSYDSNGKLLYKLSSFNKGSSNFYKVFETSKGTLVTWPVEEQSDFVYTKDYIEKTSAIQTV